MARVKKKDWENLTPENIEKVIALLSPSDGTGPITKKEACEILNISYNTKRLASIIDDHLEQKEYVKLRKSQNRGKPASDGEIREIIRDYLQGDNVTSIAKSLYRTPGFIKNIIETLGVPSRPKSRAERSEVAYLPEECVAEEFEPGEIAWSARHHCAVEILNEMSVDYQAEKPGFHDTNYEKKYGAKCYAIWVMEDIDTDKEFWVQGIETGGYNAFALSYDLGKLSHLQKYIDLKQIAG